MCAIPPPARSTLRRVVGFVLAAMLANVRGSERYEDDECDGEGDGGVLGGNGRTEASSSASRTLMLVGDHNESRANEPRQSSSESTVWLSL